MTKDQYLKLFQNPYNQPDWELFLKELIPGTTVFPTVRELRSSTESVIQIVEFGEYQTADRKKLKLFAVQLANKKIARNRVGINKIIGAELSPGITDGALVVFFDAEQPEWRFSFLAKANIKGGKVIETSFQRFTYVFGTQETHQTARGRMEILAGSDKKLEHFQEAFNVEKLNNAFFKRYEEIYQWFCKDLVEKTDLHFTVFGIQYPKISKKEEVDKLQKPIRDFVKLLMGRIMFIYFLQKKGWMGCPIIDVDTGEIMVDWKNGNPNFLQNIFTGLKEEEQKEFYSGILTALFFNTLNNPNRENDIFDLTQSRVPYLNGGLFHDAHPATNVLNVDPQIFKDLFEFLAQFNFTIYEDSPDDQEVGIDPEMLGRIFESLLEANKAFGTFYTPKPVVHYMCQESLLSYLKLHLLGDVQALGSEAEAIDVLVRTHERPVKKEQSEYIKLKAKDIEGLLEKITICDPAVGSGAFPMGMMQEILYIRQALDWTLADPAGIKKGILQNNIYGVDLDGGAVEIARLRFWLSLVVDEEKPEPLPNLDYKIMQGNSLLESFEGIPLSVEEEMEPGDEATIKNGQLDMFGNVKDGQLGIFGSGKKVERTITDDEVKKLKILVDQFFTIGGNTKSGKSVIQEKEETKAKIDGIITEAIRRKIKKHKDFLDARQRERMAQRILLEGQLKQPNLSPAVKSKAEKAKARFDKEQEIWNRQYDAEQQKEKRLEATLKVAEKPYFLWHLYFGSVFEKGGFDLIIGNPPYGGTPIPDDLQDSLGLGSTDVYGAFMGYCLQAAGKDDVGKSKPPLLRPNGLLSFIVSDTFMTIKSHKQLRTQMMQHRLLKMVRMHPKTFKATVNTAIVLAQRNEVVGTESKIVNELPNLQMVDLTTVNPHDEYDLFRNVLSLTQTNHTVSNSRYAIYHYPQSLIATNSNLPFFVASPKLFGIMNDQNSAFSYAKVNEKELKVRKVRLNDKIVKLIKLGEIAEVKVGLQTGDNDAYLFQNPEARGSYRSIKDFEKFLLTEADLDAIRSNDELRLSVIENGISKEDQKSDRYFGGRFIVPYDKGGESDSEEGWMPNYYVPTNYFIDWSEWAVKRMKTYTIKERIIDKKETKPIEPHYATTTAAVFRSPRLYFVPGITYSPTGIFSPTFRINSTSIFGNKGSSIFLEEELTVLTAATNALLCSKLSKSLIKCFLSHTVETPEDKLFQFPIYSELENLSLDNIEFEIVKKQKEKIDYDYASNEQIEIDRLVYEAYGLIEEDIREVECWYARRYPKLAEAQLRNLKKLGKTKEYEYFKQYWQSDPMLQPVEINLPERKEKIEWLTEIAQLESKTLEFKSTLIWDVKEGKKNPVMEHSVLKTLAAFMNSEGGVLYIGVTDEKQIFGLGADIKALGKGNVDGVLLHLDNLIKNSLGVANQQYLIHTVGELEGKSVIRFEIKPAKKEVWLTFNKKDGKGKQEEFYIRGQAGTVALQENELEEYIMGRF